MRTREHLGIGTTDRQRDRPDFHPPANFPPLNGILGPVENSKPLIPTALTKTPIVDEGFRTRNVDCIRRACAYIRTFTALHTEAGADGEWNKPSRRREKDTLTTSYSFYDRTVHPWYSLPIHISQLFKASWKFHQTNFILLSCGGTETGFFPRFPDNVEIFRQNR